MDKMIHCDKTESAQTFKILKNFMEYFGIDRPS